MVGPPAEGFPREPREGRSVPMSTDAARAALVRWVATEIMPHEPGVRAWLLRSLPAGVDVDDVIQDAYCKLSSLQNHQHVARPDAFFFQTARNIA